MRGRNDSVAKANHIFKSERADLKPLDFLLHQSEVSNTYRNKKYVHRGHKIASVVKHLVRDDNLNSSQNTVLYITHGWSVPRPGRLVEYIKQVLELLDSKMAS